MINDEENLQVISQIIETYHKNLQELSEYFKHEQEIEKKKIFGEDERIWFLIYLNFLILLTIFLQKLLQFHGS